MSWHPAPLPSVRLLRFWRVDRYALIATANIKVGDHLRINNVRLIQQADGTYTVATRPNPAGSNGPSHDVYISPDLRSAIADLLLETYRKRVEKAA